VSECKQIGNWRRQYGHRGQSRPARFAGTPVQRASAPSYIARNPGWRAPLALRRPRFDAQTRDATLPFPDRSLSWNHASLASGPAPHRRPAGSVAATGLVNAIGRDDPNALATELLHTLGPATSVSQCTIFAYEFGNRPRTVSVADHRGGRLLRDVADTYTRLFHVLDGKQQIVTAAPAERPGSSPVLHWQSSADIARWLSPRVLCAAGRIRQAVAAVAASCRHLAVRQSVPHARRRQLSAPGK